MLLVQCTTCKLWSFCQFLPPFYQSLLHDAMLPQYLLLTCVCLFICHKPVVYWNVCWYLAWRLPFTCHTLCGSEIWVSPKIRVHLSRTLSQTPDLENFATESRSHCQQNSSIWHLYNSQQFMDVCYKSVDGNLLHYFDLLWICCTSSVDKILTDMSCHAVCLLNRASCFQCPGKNSFVMAKKMYLIFSSVMTEMFKFGHYIMMTSSVNICCTPETLASIECFILYNYYVFYYFHIVVCSEGILIATLPSWQTRMLVWLKFPEFFEN